MVEKNETNCKYSAEVLTVLSMSKDLLHCLYSSWLTFKQNQGCLYDTHRTNKVHHKMYTERVCCVVVHRTCLLCCCHWVLNSWMFWRWQFEEENWKRARLSVRVAQNTHSEFLPHFSNILTAVSQVSCVVHMGNVFMCQLHFLKWSNKGE